MTRDSKALSSSSQLDYAARDKIQLIVFAQLGARITPKEADDLLRAIKEDKHVTKFIKSKLL